MINRIVNFSARIKFLVLASVAATAMSHPRHVKRIAAPAAYEKWKVTFELRRQWKRETPEKEIPGELALR